jgi:hypothetical protein
VSCFQVVREVLHGPALFAVAKAENADHADRVRPDMALLQRYGESDMTDDGKTGDIK